MHLKMPSAKLWQFCPGVGELMNKRNQLWNIPVLCDINPYFLLIILVLRPDYSGRIEFLMPWLLVSPWHQQPLYWLYKIHASVSSTRNSDLKSIGHFNVWRKKTAKANIFLCCLKIYSTPRVKDLCVEQLWLFCRSIKRYASFVIPEETGRRILKYILVR